MRRILQSHGLVSLCVAAHSLPPSGLLADVGASTLVSFLTCDSAPVVSTSRRFFGQSTPLLMKRFRGRRPVRKRDAQEGDWQCACGETNYKSKRECFKCGAPAPALPPGVRRPSLPGEDPNDWACPCGQMNFRGSIACYKCKQPKPLPPKAPGEEVTMWKCSKCSSVNRSSRKYCFKCFCPAQLIGGETTTRPPTAV